MWKTLKKWVKIINLNVNKKVSDYLNEKLLLIKPVYQTLLLKHNGYCQDLESLRFINS